MKKHNQAILFCSAGLCLLLLASIPAAAQRTKKCDKDGDGFLSASVRCGGNDCNDDDATIHPGASEVCDGLDNNCDGAVDEECGGPVCGDGVCSVGEGCRSCSADCGLCFPFNISSMDVAGDSMSKAYNAGMCTFSDQENLNWATSDTHGSDLCSAGDEGVFSHAERLECGKAEQLAFIANPNSARSGADMLHDFVTQANLAKSNLSAAPAPRYAPVLLGHNDICGGKLLKRSFSNCDGNPDLDPNNYCRTTPAAFEREFRRGLDILITVPDLSIGVASMVRVSQLCNHPGKESCGPLRFFGNSCETLWRNVASLGFVFGDDNGICGSLTVDCSSERVFDAYQTGQNYRDILERVTMEYAAIPEGGNSNQVFIGGAWVGGATKADGVMLVFSDAAWKYKFSAGQVSCCDCFHANVMGQDSLSRLLFEGLTCGTTDMCCDDSAGGITSATCGLQDMSGTVYPGLLPPK